MVDTKQQDAVRQGAEAVQTSGRATSEAVRRGGEFAADTTRRGGEAGAEAVNRTGQFVGETVRRGTQDRGDAAAGSHVDADAAALGASSEGLPTTRTGAPRRVTDGAGEGSSMPAAGLLSVAVAKPQHGNTLRASSPCCGISSTNREEAGAARRPQPVDRGSGCTGLVL